MFSKSKIYVERPIVNQNDLPTTHYITTYDFSKLSNESKHSNSFPSFSCNSEVSSTTTISQTLPQHMTNTFTLITISFTYKFLPLLSITHRYNNIIMTKNQTTCTCYQSMSSSYNSMYSARLVYMPVLDQQSSLPEE